MVVIGALEDESGKMFGFDVRVSDQGGAPSARSAIANVFVSGFRSGVLFRRCGLLLCSFDFVIVQAIPKINLELFSRVYATGID